MSIPREKNKTIRQELTALLIKGKYSSGLLSKIVGESEKEVYGHLEQLRKSGVLLVSPAECRKCGFVFEGRVRVKKPGKCPKCKSTFIEEPLFSARARKYDRRGCS